MKKLFIFLGCMFSLSMMAGLDPSVPVYTHNLTDENADPYTCKSKNSIRLQSSMTGSTPGRIQIYEYEHYKFDEAGGVETIPQELSGSPITGSSPKYIDLNPSVGPHKYLVESFTSGQIVPGTTVTPKQYDIYYVNVKYHVEEHDTTLIADMFTGKAEMQLYTTAGQPDPKNPGKTFCGLGFKCKVNQGYSEDVTGAIIISEDASKVNDVVTLTPGGPQIYSVYMVNRYNEIMWCDRFNISVTTPQCVSGLVYSKWDDFLLVDNGEDGGKGDFVSYQWYNTGTKIKGATEQWLRTTIHEGAAPSGQYYVYITDKKGNVIVTCPQVFEDFPRSVDTNQHKAASAPARKQLKEGQLVVEYYGKWYNAQGVEIK